jgi:hypothetical protein
VSLYVYALLSAPPGGPLPRGLAGERLRVVRCAGLLAAVGRLARPPLIAPRTLRRHDRIVRRLAALTRAVLPVRFGTLVADEAALAERLAPRARELREALALVAGREQMTLRVLGGARRRARPPHVTERGRRPGTRYLASRLVARSRARQAPEVAALRPALAALVRAERVERHDAPPLLVSLYHLVTRGQAPRYRRAVAGGVAGLAVRVEVSGPWPPYAFAPEPLA